MKRFKVEKLIRDLLPRMMREEGIKVYEHSLDDKAFEHELRLKLIEEAHEVFNASGEKELIEELADVMEVIQTLAQYRGVPMEDIEQKRQEKREKRGGFDKRFYNPYVEIDENNPAISYYVERPEQYPLLDNH